MGVTLDGRRLFDELELEIQSAGFDRDSIERRVPGLDGVLSIDLGERGRKIRQRGVLRTGSRSQMDERISTISSYIDGNIHTLVTSKGEKFDNLRIDAFKATKEGISGSGFCCDYEIIYTQLAV
jgi:hypothetical protein